MRGRAALLVIAASFVGSSAAAQVTTHPREMGLAMPRSPRPDPMAHRIELPGGLVAYTAVDRTAPLVTLSVFIGAGYVDGPEGAAEALARGLRTAGPAGMAPGVFRQLLRSMTADYSVRLGPERIEITIDVPREDSRDALALLADLVRNGPALGDDVLEALRSTARSAESGPVTYEGSLGGAADLFRNNVLGGTAYGHAPSANEFEALTLDDVRAYHRRFFVSGNMVISAAGPLGASSLRQELADRFGVIESGRRHTRSRTAAPVSETASRVLIYPANKLQGWLVIGHELPVVPMEDEAAIEVMNYILGGGHFYTRLFHATRDRRGLTNDNSGFLEPSRDGPGTYAFHTYGRPEVVRLLLHLTLAEIERIRAEPVTEEELFVAMGAITDREFALRYRDGWATARSLALEWLETGSHDASADYQNRIRSVTAEDVLEVARKYMHPERMQIVLVGPFDAIEAAPAMEDEGSLSDYGRVVQGR